MLLLSLFLTIMTYQRNNSLELLSEVRLSLTVFMLGSFPAVVIRDGLLVKKSKTDNLLSSKSIEDIETCRISAGCGSCKNVTEFGGTIESSNFPLEYNPNLNCLLTITAPAGKSVSLNFTKFFVEECCDFLSVFDGVAEPLQVGLRGYNLPETNITSSDNRMTIKFSTNSDNAMMNSKVVEPGSWQATFSFV